MTSSVLTINGGSSSIKFALFDQVEPPKRSLAGAVERIGLANTVLNVPSQQEYQLVKHGGRWLVTSNPAPRAS